MKDNEVHIIGGGPAGMTAAIHLARKGVPVKVFEKKSFPHHKVCGEYLSKEVLPYLEKLGIPLLDLGPPDITRFEYSSREGKILRVPLPLGGLGISRYALDELLFREALGAGVTVQQEKVRKVSFEQGIFRISTNKGEYKAAVVLGAYGKRDGLDKSLGRKVFDRKAPWVGVKSHFELPDFPDDLVALHNFKGGYCGLSKTESGAVNVCYLANYRIFKKYGNPSEFREEVLRRNPLLDRFFSQARELFKNPVSIAQVSFAPKETVVDHVLMVGDTAGLIHPLCGNGMAMAIQSGRMAAELILEQDHMPGGMEQVEQLYRDRWKRAFRGRMRTGRWLQRILLRDSLAKVSQEVISQVPFVLPSLIARTHGNMQEWKN